MARATLKKEDAIRVRQYLLLVNGIIDFEAGTWFVDTPDDYFIFHTTDKLLGFVKENLGYMREAYERNNEMDEWEAIYNEAAESKFHFGGDSDRMDARRYV